jgi:GxxExxY protein
LIDTNELLGRIIDCAEEVHRRMGSGQPESAYVESLGAEFEKAGIRCQRDVPVPILYGESALGRYHLDFVVEDSVVVEIKAAEQITEIHEAEVLTYLTATGMRAGLLINFQSRVFRDGIKRFTI